MWIFKAFCENINIKNESYLNIQNACFCLIQVFFEFFDLLLEWLSWNNSASRWIQPNDGDKCYKEKSAKSHCSSNLKYLQVCLIYPLDKPNTKYEYVLNTKTQNIFCCVNENSTTFLCTLNRGDKKTEGEKKFSF